MPTKPRQSTAARLQRLIDDLQRQADDAARPFLEKIAGVRYTMHALNGHLTEQKKKTIDSDVEQAIKLRKHAAPAEPEEPRPYLQTKLVARQNILKDFIEPGVHYKTKQIAAHYRSKGIKLSTSSITHDLRRFGMTSHGRFSGMTWTLGEPSGEAKTRGSTRSKKKRARTLKGLDKLAAHGAPMSGRELNKLLPNHGVLEAYGYIAKQGDGYIRTEKPFTV